MKKLLTTLLATGLLLLAFQSKATPINGYEHIIDNGGGSYTFVFDTLPSDIHGGSGGLIFDDFGFALLVTNLFGSNLEVIQDHPGNGGLGVDGGPHGDNMGGGEGLAFFLGQSFSLTNILFNGLMGQNGHQNAASGTVLIAGNIIDTALFDGVGDAGDITGLGIMGTGFDIATADGEFHGYIESITIQLLTVPAPKSVIVLLLGMAVLGFRKRV